MFDWDDDNFLENRQRYWLNYRRSIEMNWHFTKISSFFFVSVKLVDVVVLSRFFRWAPMCFPSTSCSRHASTNGRSCITHPSKPSGTGLSYCWLSTRPSLRLMLPLSSSTSTILAARRARGTETIRSSSSTSWVTTLLPPIRLVFKCVFGIDWVIDERNVLLQSQWTSCSSSTSSSIFGRHSSTTTTRWCLIRARSPSTIFAAGS